MPNIDAKLDYGPIHINSNVIAAVALRPGGPDPTTSDLLEICIMPLNHSYRPSPKYFPFHVCMRPSFPVDLRHAKLNKDRFRDEFETSALDSVSAGELFEQWWARIRLKEHKKMQFLCWDWPKTKPWIEHWLGPTTYELLVHEEYRDVQTCMNFMNDRQDIRGLEVFTQIHTQSHTFSSYNVDVIDRNSTIATCKAMSDLYRKMLLR